MEDVLTVERQPLLCDIGSPEIRRKTLGIVLRKDVLMPNGFLDRESIKGRILDLGCGRGAVGAALCDINPNLRLEGVDVITSYEGSSFLGLYSKINKGSAAEFVRNWQERDGKYDLVVSWGMPDWANEEVLNEQNLQRMVNPGGGILFLFDIPLKRSSFTAAIEKGFQRHKGTFPNNPYILYWKNS